jgi:hypothetical protein
MRVHTDEDILRKAFEIDKYQEEPKDNKLDVAVDLDDEHGVCHTYVVSFQKNGNEWDYISIEEISSL